ncbi:MAG: PAS domain-containing protein [Elusimicrobia bacterium]|nr:PAS domain-containing protein [Elusimicrobiota bacterium]
MDSQAWAEELPSAITVCDENGAILAMNRAAAGVFKKEGGRTLIGRNLLDCHPEPARSRLKALFASRSPNTYTVEKEGRRKLVHQSPWFRDGRFAGFVELSIVLPEQLEHRVRGPRSA